MHGREVAVNYLLTSNRKRIMSRRGRRNTEGLLARVNFPLYTIQMLTNRHVLVAGGGGSAKTGVANGFVSLVQGE